VSPDAALRNLLIIYFYTAPSLDRSGMFLHWVGISMVAPFDVVDHFTQFLLSGGGSQVLNTLLKTIWFATIWEIWKEKNNRIFKDKECSIMHVIDKIKSLSFSWLKEKFVQFSLNYHGWWLSPLAMIGIS